MTHKESPSSILNFTLEESFFEEKPAACRVTRHEDLSDGEKVFSVSELSFSLKKRVETTFAAVCVRGEISNLRQHSSGHIYFALKDDQAVLDAVYWKGALRARRVVLEEGLEVRCWAQLTTYPARSKYQLVVNHYELAGQGALLKMLEDRKQRLLHEGVFDQKHKKKLPFLPRKIGVVTSPTGAVLRDILHRIADRFPISVVVWPVLVQGEEAAFQVAEAVRRFNTFPLRNRPDVLIVARGGGSFEDLLPFNEENVVRAVFDSAIPVISAIGHETDTTLIDFAADIRAPTPTAAAELVVPRRHTLLSNLATLYHQLGQALERYADKKKHCLHACIMPPVWRITGIKTQELDHYTDKLTTHMYTVLRASYAYFTKVCFRLWSPSERFLINDQHIKALSAAQMKAMGVLFETQKTALRHAVDLLEKVSFARLLKRGFAFVRSPDGSVIASAAEAQRKERFDVVFYDGTCTVAPIKGKRSKSASKQEKFVWT
ncbi:MAG: exodeoxyribonuclease VII large subunit [Holosporales bacterium]|nr:exodeoxyribonuclease VII large subunit [Holosporales bacterium]